MSAPTEKHREEASAIAALSGSQYSTARNIAYALAAADERGMKRGLERAAEIARGNSGEFDFQKALAECEDHTFGYHNGRNAAADAILSEAGEG